MTDYAAIADVEPLLKRTGRTPFSGSSNPTSTQVTTVIEDIEAELNGVLAAEGYANVPATSTADVKLLRRYVAEKVAASVWAMIFAENEFPAHVKAWRDDYASFISRLRRGEQYLPSQQPQSESEPVFLVVRTQERDDYFTNRLYPTSDWDE